MSMAKKKTKKIYEPDSVFFLKLVLYFILGAIWIRLHDVPIPGVPVGLIVGILFARQDHFQIDRKIEYAILLGAAIISFVAPVGLVLQFAISDFML